MPRSLKIAFAIPLLLAALLAWHSMLLRFGSSFRAEMPIGSAYDRMSSLVETGMTAAALFDVLDGAGLSHSKEVTRYDSPSVYAGRTVIEAGDRVVLSMVRHRGWNLSLVIRELQFIFFFDQSDRLDHFRVREVLTGP